MRREPDVLLADTEEIRKEAGNETARVLSALVKRVEAALDDRGRVRNNFEVAHAKAALVTGDNVTVPVGGKVYVDGEGDTYIWEVNPNELQVVVAGSGAVSFVAEGTIFTSSIKGTTGDPTGVEGLITINTFDNAIKLYADGAWRTLVSW